MKNAGKIALGGIITSLSVIIMFLGGIIPEANYAFPAAAGILLMIIAIEIDSRWAFMVFLAVSGLSMLVLYSREAGVFYTAFFGHYPIIKGFLERLKPKILTWIVKYLVFNLCVVTAFWLVLSVFGIKVDGTNELGRYTMYILWGVGNAAFVIYDLALSSIERVYMSSLHPHLKRLVK